MSSRPGQQNKASWIPRINTLSHLPLHLINKDRADLFLLASVTSKNIASLRRRWKAEGGFSPVNGQRFFKSEQGGTASATRSHEETIPVVASTSMCWDKTAYVLPTDDTIGTIIEGKIDFTGSLILIDLIRKQIIWESDWAPKIATPHGFCIANEHLYINDLEAAHVFAVPLDEPSSIVRRFSNPGFNDIHSIVPTGRGFLITSTGADCIIEVDRHGNSLWEWWAVEHGFDLSASGELRASGRGQELRNKGIHTRFQTTHVNNAAVAGANEEYVLASLFHQGMFILIDRRKPAAAQRAEIIISGLARPHGPTRFRDGWLVCNSLGEEVLIFDEQLSLTERVPYSGGWIQDATMMSDGRLALNDVDKHRIVLLTGTPWYESDRFEYDHNWRVGQLMEIDSATALKFMAAAKRSPERDPS